MGILGAAIDGQEIPDLEAATQVDTWWAERAIPGHFHYDVTDSKRSRALVPGAKPVRYRDPPEIMRGRDWLAGHGGPLRILATGSRERKNEAMITDALTPYRWLDAVLVSGHCPRGADAICEKIWAS